MVFSPDRDGSVCAGRARGGKPLEASADMIFQDLTPDEMATIEKLGTLRVYPPGEPLIREGTEGTSFALILAGRAEIRKALSGGRYKKLADVGPADVVGEMGFLGVRARSASVVALTECQVLEFGQEQFEQFLVQHPAVGVRVYRGIAWELARRLSASDEHLLDTLVWALEHKEEESLTRDALIPPRRKKLELRSRDGG